MADTFAANIRLHTNVAQTLDSSAAPASNSPKITHAGWDFSHDITASSTPPITKHAAFQQALTAGAATIDLTSLTGLNGEAVDGSGLKVQVLKLRNPSGNANGVSIAPAAANGYDFLGSDFKLTLQPGDEVILYTPETADDIAAADKDLTLAGTGSQALDVEVLMG